MDNDDFWWQYLEDNNIADLLRGVASTMSKVSEGYDKNHVLYGIVSNEDGGIIAYAIGQEHAEQFVRALKRVR